MKSIIFQACLQGSQKQTNAPKVSKRTRKIESEIFLTLKKHPTRMRRGAMRNLRKMHIAPNADVGTILSATVQSVFTLFCGFMLPYESIPVYWRPLYYLSMFRYPLGFFVSNEMRGLEFQCPVGNGPAGNNLPVGAFPVFVGGTANNVSFPPPPFGNGKYALDCVPLLANFTNIHDPRCWRFFCPISNGEFILDRYSMPTSTGGMLQQLLVMVGFFFGLRLLTFVALQNIQHISR